MKTLIQAAVVTLFAASAAHAQQAVQWRVEDGGDGHWYSLSSSVLGWDAASSMAQVHGGYLSTITSTSESAFLQQFANRVTNPSFGVWAGGQQIGDPCGAACGWAWVTGEDWAFVNWAPGEPNDADGIEDRLEVMLTASGRWNDNDSDSSPGGHDRQWLTEWSADCNGDGIVDYGQCRDGTLPDYNGNNVPDCCERGTPCVVGSYPVQWRAEDGGNGHWYRDDPSAPILGFVARNQEAAAVGAHLATVTSEGEHKFVLRVAFPRGLLGPNDMWPALGGFKEAGSTQWAWVTGESFVYAPFSPDPPQYGQAQWLMMWGINLYMPLLWWTGNGNTTVGRAILEWSSDCNGDGIVDYGQILQGQLADTNADGVPDICQVPTCVDADLFRDFNVNGADLGILLSQWGPNTPLTVSDLNGDGGVDGADLGLFLSFWGACP